MRGISEKRLREIAADSIPQVRYVVEVLLARECKELNNWKPIDNDTPTNRQILLYCPMPHTGAIHNEFVAENLNGFVKTFYNPTHWQELPPPQKNNQP